MTAQKRPPPPGLSLDEGLELVIADDREHDDVTSNAKPSTQADASGTSAEFNRAFLEAVARRSSKRSAKPSQPVLGQAQDVACS
jgi:hypothetical protein